MAQDATARSYKSPLREAQAEQTRKKILDGVFAVIKEGLSAVTMPAVAKAAKVSMPTVYRYFPDKSALLDAAADEVRRRVGVRYDAATTLEDHLDRARTVFRKMAEESVGFRVLAASSDGRPYPAKALAERRKRVEMAMRESLVGLRGRDRKYLIDCTMALCSSPVGVALARFGFLGDDAADRVAWLVETMLLGARARQQGNKDTRGGQDA